MKLVNKLFLGGTCNNDPWREELIPELERLGIDYFNPVVEDWNEQCRLIEQEEKKHDDFIYIITPNQTGVYSFAEIIDSVYRRLVKGCVLVGFTSRSTYNKAQEMSMSAIISLVNEIARENQCGYRIKAAWIDKPNDILSLSKLMYSKKLVK